MIVLVGSAPFPPTGDDPHVVGLPLGADLSARLAELVVTPLEQGRRCLVVGCSDNASTVERAARFVRHAFRTTAVDRLVADVSPFRLAAVAQVCSRLGELGGRQGLPAVATFGHLVSTSAGVVVTRRVTRLHRPAPSLRQRVLGAPGGSVYVVHHDGDTPPTLRCAAVGEALAQLGGRGRGELFVARPRRSPAFDDVTAALSGSAVTQVDADVSWLRRWGCDSACEVVRVRAEPSEVARATRAAMASAWGCYWCGGRTPGGAICTSCGASKKPGDPVEGVRARPAGRPREVVR